MAASLSGSLSSLVRSKYASAQASGALTFSSTHLAIVHVNEIPFQLRWCPALAQKPVAETSGTENTQDGDTAQTPKKTNPFENPAADLLVSHIPTHWPTHNVVLNKYPVIPHHFILTTKTYKSQTDKLEEDDLKVTYACLREWEPGRLFAFFNSGEQSGATQGHRHIQFLPIEQMYGEREEDSWVPLIDLMHEHKSEIQVPGSPTIIHSLPFTHFSSPIPADASSSQLVESYYELYDTAVDAFYSCYPEMLPPYETPEEMVNAISISYNFAMTTSRMAICPRRSEASTIDPGKGGADAAGGADGSVALNGTLLAGTLMVKTKEDWDALRGLDSETRLKKILKDVGVPRQNTSVM